jgi:hypothetical protein
MAQIYKVRLPDGRVVRPTEWSSTPLWSTVEVAAGPVNELQAFSYADGGTVPGSVGPRRANSADTNFRGDGAVLQENEELLLYSIQVEVFQTFADLSDYYSGNDAWAPIPPEVSATNLGRFDRDTQLVLRIADTKRYVDHPVGFFPAAMGTTQINGAARNTAVVPNAILAANHGGSNSYDNRRFATPHHVAPGEAFEITLEFPQGQVNGLNFGLDTDARMRVRIYAAGYRRRPVA